MFERHLQNGEVVNRSWLYFSPTKGKVYCYAYKLMGKSKTQVSDDGYCDWKHASTRLSEHETSKDHLESVLALVNRARTTGNIDEDLAKESEKVEQYWCKILKRIVSVLKFICERGLAVCGDNVVITRQLGRQTMAIILVSWSYWLNTMTSFTSIFKSMAIVGGVVPVTYLQQYVKNLFN